MLYGEYTSAGALVREYVYLNGQPLAQVDAGTPEVLTYIHTDHLGTPRLGTSTGGTQVWTWTSDAFGVGAPSGSRTVNLRMAGQYFDSESGLFYNWNRYYNPAIGRYVSVDPIGLGGGLNTFSYAEASPVMYTDPEGLQVREVATAGASWDASTPDPTDLSLPKWVGWGTAIGVGGVIDWCINQATSSEEPAAEPEADEPSDKGAKGPNTGNPDLDKALEGSIPGDSDKGWGTPETKEDFEEKLRGIPGAVQKPTANGGTVTTLPDGTKISTYPERTSTGKPGWSVTPPGGKDGDGGKGSFIDEE